MPLMEVSVAIHGVVIIHIGMTKERDRIGSANADKWMRDQASKAGIFGGF